MSGECKRVKRVAEFGQPWLYAGQRS